MAQKSSCFSIVNLFEFVFLRCVATVTDQLQCVTSSRYATNPPTGYDYRVVDTIPVNLDTTGHFVKYLAPADRKNVQKGDVLAIAIPLGSPGRVAQRAVRGIPVVSLKQLSETNSQLG